MTPELLAPAGSLDALRAAFCAGADAVYLGAASFGARAAVGFTPDELRDALHFAHLHGRRVYVTVNTLVRDAEWSALRDQLALLRDLRADAVLIQDSGVWRLCQSEFPELTLHASTQMTLRSPEGIRWAGAHGIRRVVLPREASMADIRAAVATGVPIEVFAHGALCVSVSGQCALSASLGERSGNRGRCAQPCRLPYTYRDMTQGWLSPADLCSLPILPELAEAGVASLKIEGRLKRPEYVYTVTNIYRRALNRIAEGRRDTADEASVAALRQIFSRGPFTSGYAGGQQDAGILSPRHTAHEGVPMGRIAGVARRGQTILASFVPERDLHDQDGLTVGPDQCVYTGPDVPAGQRATLRLHRAVPEGAPVLRTESARQLRAAQTQYTGAALRRLDLPADARLIAMPGAPAQLTLTAGGTSVTVVGEPVEPAAARPLSEAVVRQSLEKTGGAPFTLRRLTALTENAYMSSAALNALRREGLQQLEDAIAARFEASAAVSPSEPRPEEALDGAPAPRGRFYVRTERPGDIDPLLAAGADHILLTLQDTEVLPDLDRVPAGRVSLQLPPVADDDTLARLADWAAARGLGIAADNIAQLAQGRAAVAVEGIPVFNAEAEAFLRARGVKAAVVSPELSGDDLRAMPAPRLERIVPVYGRARLMLLSHCPERVRRGLDAGRADCRLCASGQGLQGHPLTDRKGLRLPLVPYRTAAGCVIRLQSGAPLSLLPYMDELRRLPVSFLLNMTDEAPDDRPRILRAFLTGEDPGIRGTAGKYLRGVD